MSKAIGASVRRPPPWIVHALVTACAALLWAVTSAATAAAADPDLPVLSGTDASTAIVVSADPRCAEPPVRMPELKLRWQIDAAKAANAPGAEDVLESTEFRVDVSMYRTFVDGRFDTHFARTDLKQSADGSSGTERLDRSLVIPNLRPAVYYSARVLAATSQGWVASETVSFLTPICPVDGID